MPDVLNVYPADVHVEIRISLSELNMLADFLDQSEFVLDPDCDENVACHAYVTKKFFPFINRLTDDLMRGAGNVAGPDSQIR